MKRLLIVLLSASLHAATYWVSSAASTPPGNDSNAGSQAAPWLTLNRAFQSPFACGDTINIDTAPIAYANYIDGNVTFPNCIGSSLTTTIQSTNWALFQPPGYRLNPASERANLGKVKITNGLFAQPSLYGKGGCQISNISGVTFTLGFCFQATGMQNGLQVFWQIDIAGHATASALPTPFVLLQPYYMKNCMGTCGTTGATFELSATPGGTSITPGACTGTCDMGALNLAIRIQVTAGSSTLVSPSGPIQEANGTQVTLSSAGLLMFGTLPTGFSLNTVYFIVNKGVGGANNFGLSATLGGTAITPSDVGTGGFLMSNSQLPHNIAIRGIEFYSPSFVNVQLTLGSGDETSIIGMVNNIEVSHSWFHTDPTLCPSSGAKVGISENGRYISIHDNAFTSFCTSEGQTIRSIGSGGPTWKYNNFLEAGGECVLSGGSYQAGGLANSYETIEHNYCYKPPTWKITGDPALQVLTGTPTGFCFWDNFDPENIGGEWFRDSSGAGQNYRCGSDHLWHTTASSLPGSPTIKTMFEHKNARYRTIIGNLVNYNWAAGQTGQMFTFHQHLDSGAGAANDHITAIGNKGTNVYAAITLNSLCTGVTFPCTGNPAGYITIKQNLIVASANSCGVPSIPASCGVQMVNAGWGGSPGSNVVLDHNTQVDPDGADTALPPPGYSASAFNSGLSESGCVPSFGKLDSWTFSSSIMPYDFQGDCTNGAGVLALYFSNTNAFNLALVGSNPAISYASPGTGNTFTPFSRAANVAAVKYVDVSNGDYHLDPTSPYSAANGSATLLSADGTDLGADIDFVNMATSGAASGAPPVNASLVVNPGSTKLVFRYQAQTIAACTATLYSAPARISGNQVASVADSAASSISDGLTRQLYISGLSASTHYWYKISGCFSTPIVGDLFTRATGSGTYSFTFNWTAATAMRYSSSSGMSSPTNLSAATTQTVPVATDSVIYAQVGTTGPITILIAP